MERKILKNPTVDSTGHFQARIHEDSPTPIPRYAYVPRSGSIAQCILYVVITPHIETPAPTSAT